jgi:hypothetical protein
VQRDLQVSDGLEERVRQLLARASAEAVLMAPFIKAATLQRLLDEVSGRVRVVVVTRWRLEEIQAGVSDLAVADVMSGRGNLLLQDNLHAKYFRADSAMLVGSANVTRSALSDGPGTNNELLVSPAREDQAALRLWESRSIDFAVPATPWLRTWLEQQLLPAEADDADSDRQPDNEWLPQLRQPGDLWLYASGQLSDLSVASLSAAHLDFDALALRPSPDQATFRRQVAARLLTIRRVSLLVDFLREERRFGEVRHFLVERLNVEEAAATNVWQGLLRYLLEYLPQNFSYRRARHSELVQFLIIPAAIDARTTAT